MPQYGLLSNIVNADEIIAVDASNVTLLSGELVPIADFLTLPFTDITVGDYYVRNFAHDFGVVPKVLFESVYFRRREDIVTLDSTLFTSGQTPVPIPDLALFVQPNFAYYYLATLYFRSSSIPNGMGVQASGPSGFNHLRLNIMVDSANGQAADAKSDVFEVYDVPVIGTGVSVINKLYTSRIEAVLSNGPNSGLITPKFFSETAMGTITIEVGSTCYARRVFDSPDF